MTSRKVQIFNKSKDLGVLKRITAIDFSLYGDVYPIFSDLSITEGLKFMALSCDLKLEANNLFF